VKIEYKMPETAQQALPAPVLWAQRSNLVYIRIAVEDVQSPEVKVEKDKIHYKGMGGANKQLYEANLNLFSDIKPEESKWINRDRGAEFVLIKAQEGPFWKRLLKEETKYHWLKIDFNKWRDEEDSDNEDTPGGGGGGGQDFEEMMRQMGGLGGMGGAGMPDLGDLDDKEDGGPDSDDEELPDLEDK
jgi:prostaglandin-E synthase